MTLRVFSAPWVLTGRPPGPAPSAPPGPAGEGAPGRPARPERGEEPPLAIADGAIALDGDTIVAVGPRAEVEARHGASERRDGVILPALVNAHLHLELSFMSGAVAGGDGLHSWIDLFISARARARTQDPGPAMSMAAEDLVRHGVAAVGDVSNTLASLGPLAQAGMAGTIFHEVFGPTPRRMAEALDAAKVMRSLAPEPPPGIRIVTSPHAIYSTPYPNVVELLRAGPGSIHLAEDPAERSFVSTGTGGFGHLVSRMGGRARDLVPKGRSAVAVVAPHLGPHHLAVHCVDLDEDDVQLLRSSGATVVLCPRSNGFISGKLPRLDLLLESGIPLAIGTDSLASSPSLAPLADVATLRRAFPAIPAPRILALAWNGPAVAAPHVGILAPGLAPGVLVAPRRGPRIEDPFEMVVAFGAEERPFEWLAGQSPPRAPSSPPPRAGGGGGRAVNPAEIGS